MAPLRQDVTVDVGKITKGIRREVDRELERIAKDLLDEARRQAPKGAPENDPDPSTTLADTGVIEAHKHPDGIFYDVAFTAPYALKQHEAKHFEHPQGGKAKYLADPLKQKIPEIKRRVQAAVERGAR